MKKTVTEKEVKKLLEENRGEGDPNIGQIVAKNIVLVKKLGEGAMGAVYLGADTVINRWVAVKVLFRERFEVEAEFLYMKDLLIKEGGNIANLKHPGIILVYGVDADYPALIMEHIDGMTFHEYLYQQEIRDTWCIPAFRQWFLSKMLEVAEAMRFAHSHGLIHKDLKPSNVMISQDEHGKWNKMTVIDFGLAQDNRKIKLTDGESVIGTPSYMAPEQWADLWEIDRRTDVFSFGVILYEILMRDDYHGRDADIPRIMENVKNSGFLQSRVGHLPLDQRSVFKLCLASARAQRAGGMLEVIGLLRGLKDSMKDREREFPGTSFPPIPGTEEAASAPTEEPAQPAPPAPASSKPKAKSKRHDKTILGQPGVVEQPVPEPKTEAEQAPEPEPEPAMAAAEERVNASLRDFVSNEDPPVDFGDAGVVQKELDKEHKKTKTALIISVIAVAAVFLFGVPLLYSHFNGKSKKTKDDDPAPTLISKAKPRKVIKPAPMVMAPAKPKVMKPAVKKPVKPVITKLKPAKPEPPKAPAAGEFPSSKYVEHLYQREVDWCKKHDEHRDRYDKSTLWLTWCLRKRVVTLYNKELTRYKKAMEANKKATIYPEVAIAMMDEVRSQRCFWEMTKGDPGAKKECGRIRNLAFRRFTYYIKGAKFKQIDKYIQSRTSHRAKIRAAWKKAHSK